MSWETDWLESRSRLTPEHTAVIDGETGEQWSYGQLNQRACHLAAYLRSLGIVKGDRIAYLSPNHISTFDFLFACMKLGAIFVPLNWRLSVHELNYMLHDCTPKLLTYHGSLEALASELTVPFRLPVDKSDDGHLPRLDHHFFSENVEEKDPLAIIYTGGTTGKPKGVLLSHRAISWNSINTILSWDLSAKDVTLTLLPMFHTGGLNALSIPILHMGGTVVLARGFDPVKTIRMINQYQCTIVLMVPTMYHMLIQTKEFEESGFPSMHTFLSGGAPCQHTIYQAFEAKGLAFKEGYGLTEAGPNNFFIDPSESRKKRGSVGKTMMYNRVKLVDSSGAEVKPGEVGEIMIQGPHVFSGYWNNPEATNETIIDGWLYTGDLGKRDEDGYFYIVGRKKDMIITGGENVYPLEVEHLLSQHPAVDEVAVVGLPDEKWGEVVTAVLVLKKGASLTADQLKEYCSGQLGKYKVPKKFIILKELPKTPVGKIDKKEIMRSLR
ncbi:long-chain fatty acid--CoA ligase [Microaerobacter geothermalis]|uniref:acyl-CoA synthetase n=1 Tax=Microaerobacter geothermalis TaxID=674972 RepID=UPI001F1E99DE|nr:long-chain fatty acid--CoA ligase [Microaerobacter geothermalis]MCF6092814.1 long-chain fatty acid--CoA ligase [Microaerobacter geothermalis]